MLRYIYTSVYSLDESQSDLDVPLWLRHLHVAILADQYDIPALEEAEFDACTSAIMDEGYRNVNVPLLIAQAANYHDRDGDLSSILLEILDERFVVLFEHADVRRWLENHVELREQFIVDNFDELINRAYFRQMLREDGEMALRLLDGRQSRIFYMRAHAAACGRPSSI